MRFGEVVDEILCVGSGGFADSHSPRVCGECAERDGKILGLHCAWRGRVQVLGAEVRDVSGRSCDPAEWPRKTRGCALDVEARVASQTRDC